MLTLRERTHISQQSTDIWVQCMSVFGGIWNTNKGKYLCLGDFIIYLKETR